MLAAVDETFYAEELAFLDLSKRKVVVVNDPILRFAPIKVA